MDKECKEKLEHLEKSYKRMMKIEHDRGVNECIDIVQEKYKLDWGNFPIPRKESDERMEIYEEGYKQAIRATVKSLKKLQDDYWEG